MLLLAKSSRSAASGLALMVTLAFAPLAHAGEVYLSVNGSDRNDGSSAETAVATLGNAVSVALARAAKTGEPMKIVVGPGIYRDQTVRLSDTALRTSLTITGTSTEPAKYPAFYGSGWQTWLQYRGSSGRSTGLAIRNLRIVDYSTAISLNGDRDDPERANKGTVIADNVFARIGSRPGSAVSTAAIRLLNSHDNLIENNYFHTIRNNPVQTCGALHSIYVAHYSSGNRIRRNRFQDFCGAAIKLRDRSNDNQIVGNAFKTSDKVAAIQEWYCDKSSEAACTKALGECPSTGNLASLNTFVGIRDRRKIRIDGHSRPLAWCSVADFSMPRVALQ